MAITLMSIVLSSIALTGISTTRADTKGHQASVATSLALAQLEKMRALSRSDPAWQAGSHAESSLGENGTSQASGPYTRQSTVQLDYNGHANLERVTVRVSWTGGVPVTLSSLYW
jgi:type II secretory pathway pseudopilin PulG